MDICDEQRDQLISEFIAFSKAQSTGIKRRKASKASSKKKKRHRKYLSLPFRPKQRAAISKEAALAEAVWEQEAIPEDDDDDVGALRTFAVDDHVHGAVDAASLRRGDLIFIVDHELIDTAPSDLESFCAKYTTPTFEKRSTLRLRAKQSEFEDGVFADGDSLGLYDGDDVAEHTLMVDHDGGAAVGGGGMLSHHVLS